MRTLCEDLPSIDLAWLKRYRVMRTGAASRITWGDGHTTGLISRADNRGLEVAINLRCYRLEFCYTNTPFGGRRRWFACPDCKQACRIIYIKCSGLACRRCSGLGYASEYETLADTALKRARAIVKRLGGSVTELPLVIPEKPPRMHWETYFKLKERCRELEALWARQCSAILAGSPPRR